MMNKYKIPKYKAIASETVETGIDCVEKGDEIIGYCYYSYNELSYIIVTRLKVESGGVGSGIADVHIQVKENSIEVVRDCDYFIPIKEAIKIVQAYYEREEINGNESALMLKQIKNQILNWYR